MYSTLYMLLLEPSCTVHRTCCHLNCPVMCIVHVEPVPPDSESIVIGGECDVNNLYDGQTALHTAAEQGCVGVVAKLIELGCDMNKTDSNGLAALHHAATEGHVDVIAKLIELRQTARD